MNPIMHIQTTNKMTEPIMISVKCISIQSLQICGCKCMCFNEVTFVGEMDGDSVGVDGGDVGAEVVSVGVNVGAFVSKYEEIINCWILYLAPFGSPEIIISSPSVVGNAML